MTDQTPVAAKGREGLNSLIGQEFGPGRWVDITQEKVTGFADAIEDPEWLHVDVEEARKSRFGNTIAQGFLLVAYTPGMIRSLVDVHGFNGGTNYGCGKIRFPSSVITGSRIRVRTRLAGVDDVKGGVQATWESTVEVEGNEKPGCFVENLMRYFD